MGKKGVNCKVYSPPCAAITSCSTRGACSPVGCSHRLEYASWGQATICQIKPIAHVRRAVSSVLFSCVCFVANVSCMHYAPSSPIVASRRVVSRCYTLRIFVRRPEGCDYTLPVGPLRACAVCTPQNALGRGTDSRNVVYDFHHDRAILGPFNASRYGSAGLKQHSLEGFDAMPVFNRLSQIIVPYLFAW